MSSGVKCWAKKAMEDRIKLGVTIHRGLIWNIHARENFAWHMVEKEKGVKQRKTERGKLLIQTFTEAASMSLGKNCWQNRMDYDEKS